MLNGGLPAWQQAGGELETSPPKGYPPSTYPVPQKDESLVRSFEQMTELVKKGDQSVQILDARSAGRSVAANISLTLDFMAMNLSHEKVAQFGHRLLKYWDCRLGIFPDQSHCLSKNSLIRGRVNFTKWNISENFWKLNLILPKTRSPLVELVSSTSRINNYRCNR